MRFGLSEQQVQLQDMLGKFLKDAAGSDRVRTFVASGDARALDVVRGLSDLGVTGIVTREESGGAELSLLDAALAAETLGTHITPAPFIATSVLVPFSLQRFGSPAQQARWLGKLASGEGAAGAALSEQAGAREDAGVHASQGVLNGRALFPVDFESDVYLVADTRSGLHLVEANAPGLTRVRHPTIDVTRPAGELLFDNVAADSLPTGGDHAVRLLLDVGRVMFAADSLGAAQTMLDRAVAYAKEREQFGRPIATFQAVKHMCAEMAAALEPCRAMVWFAAHALDTAADDASLTASLTKAHVSEVATFVARTATEVHGGMGFTDLVGLHYWFKRIGYNRQALGGPQRLREDAARLQGLVG
jgi:alkylation response protein AidB-like acyl-CoA dehydrogenase